MKSNILHICLCLSSSTIACGLFLVKPTFDNAIKSERYFDEPRMYCEYLRDRCSALIFFKDGTVIGYTPFFSMADTTLFSKMNTSIYESNNSIGWGKYWLHGDTVFYDFARFENAGGALHYPKISRKFVISMSDSIMAVPARNHRSRSELLLGANRISIYYKVSYPDIHNIDPSKAWINRR